MRRHCSRQRQQELLTTRRAESALIWLATLAAKTTRARTAIAKPSPAAVPIPATPKRCPRSRQQRTARRTTAAPAGTQKSLKSPQQPKCASTPRAKMHCTQRQSSRPYRNVACGLCVCSRPADTRPHNHPTCSPYQLSLVIHFESVP